MSYTIRMRAQINVRAVVILVSSLVVLGAGLVIGHYVRKRAIASDALEQGRQALAGERFTKACRHFKDYLQRYPDDTTVLREFADANLEVVPLEPANVGAAIGAYRRLLRLQPASEYPYLRLAALYNATTNHSELGHLARQRLGEVPEDPTATLFLTTALLGQGREAEATQHLDRVIAATATGPHYRGQFVDACLQKSQIAQLHDKAGSDDAALQWLDRATEAELPLAYARRALFFRTRRNPLGEISLAELAERARNDLQRADDLGPTDPRVRLLLSQEWMAHGEFDRATAEITGTEKLTPDELQKYFLRAADWETLRFTQMVELALRRGEPQQALPMVNDMLAIKADRLGRLAILPSAIELFAAAGHLEQADRYLAELQDCLLTQGRGSRYEETPALLAAIIADARREPYAVVARLESFLASEVSRPKIYSLLGRALVETNQHRRAIRALQQYINREPDDRAAALQLVREFLHVRSWMEAVETAHWAQLRWPGSAHVLLTSAEARVRAAAESPVAARQLDRQALQRDLDALQEALPNLIEVALLRAEFQRQDGLLEEARRTLEGAVANCDDPLPARLTLAELAASQGDMPEALSVAREACAAYPRMPVTWRLLAELHEEQGNVEDAHAALAEGLNQAEGAEAQIALHTARALLNLRNNDRDAGIEELKRLAEAHPEDARIRSVLLDIPEVRRDTEMAEQLVADLRSLEGETGLLWRVHQAARLLSEPEAWQNQYKEIASLLETCINADPGWEAPVLLLGELYHRTGTASKAEAVYRRTLSANAAATRVGESLLRLLERERRFAEAREVVTRLETTAPVPHSRQVRLFLQEGAWRDALEYLKLHLARNERDVMAQAMMARLVFQQSGDVDQALACLENTEADAGLKATVASARADILHAAGRTDEAIAELNAIVANGSSRDAYWLRGEFLAQLGRIEAAEADFRRVQELSEDDRGYIALGALYAAAGRISDAVQTLDSGCQAFPNNANLRRELIEALLTSDTAEDRLRAERLLRQSGGSTPADLVLQARLVLEDQTPQSRRTAEDLLNRAVNADPSLPEAYLYLIDISTERGDHSGAQGWATRGLGALPRHPRLLMARAQCEARLKNAKFALELANAALEQRDGSLDLLTQYADLVLAVGDGDDAEKALSLFEQLTSQGDDVLRRVARLLDRTGQTDAAIERLEAARSDPQMSITPEMTLVLAELRFKSGEQELAGRLVKEALAQQPENPRVRRAAVLWHAERSQWDEIVELVEGQPMDTLAAAQEATIAAAALSSAGAPELNSQAVALLGRVTERFPELVKPRMSLAYLQYRMGQPAAAEASYRLVLEQEPFNPRALNDLAWLMAERGEFAPSLELINRAIRLDPNNPNALDTRAMIYEGMDRLQDARVDRERCVTLSGADTAEAAGALVKLAELYRKLDDPGSASDRLERALNIDKQIQVFTQNERARLLEQMNAAAVLTKSG
jgi:tetratricopeptide (TPR) repeat protein